MFFIFLFSSNSVWTQKSELIFNTNISTHIINKDTSSYKMFRIDTNKVSIVTLFRSGLKIIHIHTRTRANMIVTDRSFTSDVNMCFISMNSLAISFCILEDFTLGTFLKGNNTIWEKFICSKSEWSNNNMGVKEIMVSKSKVPLQEAFLC